MKRLGISSGRFALVLGACAILGFMPLMMLGQITLFQSYATFGLLVLGTFILSRMIRPTIKRHFLMNPRKLRMIAIVIMIATFVIPFFLPPNTPRLPILFVYSILLMFTFIYLSVRYDWTLEKFWGWISAKSYKQEIKKIYVSSCPECGNGSIMESENRFFLLYRCSNYPKCKRSKRIRK